MTPPTGAQIVVVGAGIVGAAIAEALALEGCIVTVIEAGVIGGGATAAGMGHVVVMDDSEAQLALTGYSQRLWDARAGTLPAGGERMVCGTLWVAADSEEMGEVARKREVYARVGIGAEVLDEKGVAEAEPELRKGLAGGLLVRGDSVVYPPPICAAMLKEVERRGGKVLLKTKVVKMTGRAVTLLDGRVIECDYAVNATGAAAGLLSAGIEVKPRKGHLVITDRYPGFVKHQLVELGYLKSAHASTGDSVAFNVQPRPTGQVLIGSSRQFGVEGRGVDFGILGRMLRRAAEYMPRIGELSAIRTWTGFRAATADKLPLIGPVAGDERLLLATGHEGLGITTSLGTAKLIADHVMGRRGEIGIEPYLPTRVAEAVAHG